MFEVKRRKFILYSLILSVLLIQLVIFFFYYNENHNSKKIDKIEQQIHQSNAITDYTSASKKEYEKAQEYLGKYFASQKKEDLELYFSALDKVTENLSKFGNFGERHPEFQKYVNKTDFAKVSAMKVLIDSTRQVIVNQKNIESLPPIEYKKLDLKVKKHDFKFKVEKKTDTVKKKGLFGRLSDAIKGDQQVKTDSIIITNEKGESYDPEEINREIKKIVEDANAQYLKKLREIRGNVTTKNVEIQKSYLYQYDLFNKLLSTSNGLLKAYDMAVSTYKGELENRLKTQTVKNNNIRSNTVFGLMILMFLVSIIIIYYIKQSFDYEKKLQQANQMINTNLNFKNRIIGMLSHEMRAPMQIMNIFLDRIKKKTQDETVLDYLKSMKFTNHSLLTQANQILEYSKDQNKKEVLKNSTINLYDNITTIITSFKAFTESRSNILLFENHIPKDLRVYSDTTKIFQLFTNILSNANKFTENGKISVLAKIENTENHLARLIVSITDTGTGISPSDIDQIFKPYYRGVLSENVENMGAGLGLNLCKEIIDLFGGEIHAESTLGKGTKINFEMDMKIMK